MQMSSVPRILTSAGDRRSDRTVFSLPQTPPHCTTYNDSRRLTHKELEPSLEMTSKELPTGQVTTSPTQNDGFFTGAGGNTQEGHCIEPSLIDSRHQDAPFFEVVWRDLGTKRNSRKDEHPLTFERYP